jgi:hypothetical protein
LFSLTLSGFGASCAQLSKALASGGGAGGMSASSNALTFHHRTVRSIDPLTMRSPSTFRQLI